MTYAAMISKSGQVTLPRAIAKILGVQPGQRLLYDVSPDGKTVTISREKTIQDTLSDIDKIRSRAVRRRPSIAANIARDAFKAPSEVRQEWDASPAGRAYYQEKYGL